MQPQPHGKTRYKQSWQGYDELELPQSCKKILPKPRLAATPFLCVGKEQGSGQAGSVNIF